MKFISNSGNLFGANQERENSPEYIDEALTHNVDVKVDLWVLNDEIFLGSDSPRYKVSLDWLISRYQRLWISCKNIDAMKYLNSHQHFNYFWGEGCTVSLTSLKYFWTTYWQFNCYNCVIYINDIINLENDVKCYAVCSDNILSYYSNQI
jgi:hypothetical protein